MNEVEKITQTISALLEKQKAANQRAVELFDERGRIAFSVHGDGDPKARSRLDKINTETSTLASEQASIEAAITEAKVRLDFAHATEAQAADRANALLLREKTTRFKELGIDLDGACADVAQLLNEMIAALDEIHSCKQAFPSGEQFRIGAVTALQTLLQSLPQHWVRDFEFQRLQPHQKKTFGQLVSSWSAAIDNSVAARLREKKTEAA